MLANGVDLVGNEPVSLPVNGVGGFGVRRVNQAEDLPRFLVHPVAQVADSVRCLGGQVGLVGAGGGFISVPFMTWCNISIHNAVATSAALGFPIAVANVLGYAVSGQSVQGLPAGSFGYIWLPALAVIALCSVLTAPLGAKAAHSLPVKKLKRVFASILYMLAAYMLWKGLHG